MSTNESGHAEVDGLKVYYELHGGSPAGDTAPIVLLHGGMVPIDMAFTPDLIPRFSKARPVIAIEQQGHGHTADRPGPVTLERMIEDTSGVLKHLGVKKVHLFGHSLGGMIASGLCILHPDQVASATLAGSFYRLDGMLPELVKMQTDPTHVPSAEIIPLLPTEQDFAGWKATYDKYNPDPSTFDDVLAKLNVMLGSWPGWTTEQMKSIRAKVLVAIGDNDFTRIEHAAEMYRLIPEARLAILPHTTHMNIIERGDWLEPMMAELIAAAEA